MNLGFKKSIDLHVFKKIIEIKNTYSFGYVTINVENEIIDDFKTDFIKEGITINENRLELISDILIQYKFEWD